MQLIQYQHSTLYMEWVNKPSVEKADVLIGLGLSRVETQKLLDEQHHQSNTYFFWVHYEVLRSKGYSFDQIFAALVAVRSTVEQQGLKVHQVNYSIMVYKHLEKSS